MYRKVRSLLSASQELGSGGRNVYRNSTISKMIIVGEKKRVGVDSFPLIHGGFVSDKNQVRGGTSVIAPE